MGQKHLEQSGNLILDSLFSDVMKAALKSKETAVFIPWEQAEAGLPIGRASPPPEPIILPWPTLRRMLQMKSLWTLFSRVQMKNKPSHLRLMLFCFNYQYTVALFNYLLLLFPSISALVHSPANPAPLNSSLLQGNTFKLQVTDFKNKLLEKSPFVNWEFSILAPQVYQRTKESCQSLKYRLQNIP